MGRRRLSLTFILYFAVFILCRNICGTQASDAQEHTQERNRYMIGTYYFPGWSPHRIGAPSDDPWASIKRFPEREPMIGWYDDASVGVLDEQIRMMHQAGLRFVAFDWYMDRSRTVRLDQALEAYRQAKDNPLVDYCLLWANHGSFPASSADWNAMVRYWIDNYFSDKQYLRIDNRPVLFVFSAADLEAQARKIGVQSAVLLRNAQILAKQHGLPGIYFVAGTISETPQFLDSLQISGYNALSAYNYHTLPESTKYTHSYRELDQAYRAHWERLAAIDRLPLIPAATVGWDRRPWGGSSDPLHDDSLSSPEEFETHLRALKDFMSKHPRSAERVAIICCWNELGEGSYIEPTMGTGTSYLNVIRRVFADR